MPCPHQKVQLSACNFMPFDRLHQSGNLAAASILPSPARSLPSGYQQKKQGPHMMEALLGITKLKYLQEKNVAVPEAGA